MELLAPAGSWESLVAAVHAGADAVYLGGKRFSARSYAANFSDEEIAEAVRYAHGFGVKVYATINTLLMDSELEEALEFAYQLNQAGVDALIVQDLGFLWALRRIMPEVEIHASTQMTIHNSPHARLVSELGCTRAVLAREMTLAEIETIASNERLQVEVFVHGALCFSYSGQCLLSSLIGGRSGNRGACAQPCRRKYAVVTLSEEESGRILKEGFLLSCRDLNALSLLPDLRQAGATALKIEGRMKRPEYVAVVTSVYRRYLDILRRDGIKPGSHWRIDEEDLYRLEQIFNRKFTTGYLTGNPGSDLVFRLSPANQGVYLGKVRQVRGERAEVLLERPVALGDGIEYRGRGGTVITFIRSRGVPVERAETGSVVEIPSMPGVVPMDEVFLTSSAELQAYAKKFIDERQRFVPIEAVVEARIGQHFSVSFTDQMGNSGYSESPFVVERARKRPLTEADIRDKVGRIGDTQFYITQWDIRLDKEAMVPFSVLNDTRRSALEALQENRLYAMQPKKVPENWEKRFMLVRDAVGEARNRSGGSHDKPVKLAVRVCTASAAKESLDSGADIVYLDILPPRREIPSLSAAELASFLSLTEGRLRSCLTPAFPRIIKDWELPFFHRLLDDLADMGVGSILLGNLGLLAKARKKFSTIIFDSAVNAFNSFTLHMAAELGASRVTVSPELNVQAIRRLRPPLGLELEFIVHGWLEVMTSEHCPLGKGLCIQDGPGCGVCSYSVPLGLMDEKGKVFPFSLDSNCRLHIYNSAELCMLGNIGKVTQVADVVRIEGTLYEPWETGRIVAAYRRALDGGSAVLLEERLKELLGPREYTKGHYFRGV